MINSINSFSTNNYDIYSSMVTYSMMTNNTQTISNMMSQDATSIYNQYVNTNYLDTFQSKLSSLESSSQPLVTSEIDSVFKERTASSSDTSVLTATADLEATKTDYNIEVNQLAKIQRNESSSFDSDTDASNNFTVGENTFEISQNGSSKELTVNVESSDTNLDVLQKMEQEIDNSGLNVKADVVKTGDGTSYLEVESTKTGADYSFSFSDVKNDLISSSGISNTTQTAQDANYSVDGSSYISSSNEVTIDNGDVTLNLEGTGTAEVTVSSNTEAITNQVESFIEDYNDTVNFLKSDLMNENAIELANKITDISQNNEWDLENIGINVKSSGKLSLDEDEFSQALDNDIDQVEETLGGVSGVATQINNQAEETLTNPLSKYSELQNYSFYNSMGQTNYFQEWQTGLLFNYYL